MRNFRTRLLTAVMVAGALAATSSPAAFASTDPYAGQPNCHGQTIANNNHAGLPTSPGQNVGVGEVAHFLQDQGLTFVTVPFLQQSVDQSCSV